MLTAAYARAQQLVSMKDVPSVLLAKSGQPFTACAWSPDGKTFATAWNNSVLIWSAETNTVIAACGGHRGQINSLAYSGNGRYLISAGSDNSVILYDTQDDFAAIKISGTKLYDQNNGVIQDAAISYDGTTVYFAPNGTTVSSYLHLVYTDEISTLDYKYQGHRSAIHSLRLDKSGSRMVTAAQDGRCIVWDIPGRRQLAQFDVYAQGRLPVLFTPDGMSVLRAGARNRVDITTLLGRTTLSIKEPDNPVNAAAFDADGSHLAMATEKGTVKYYDAKTGRVEKIFSTLHTESGAAGIATSLAFSPDGEFLIAGTVNGCLFRWSIHNAESAAPAEEFAQYAGRLIAAEPEAAVTDIPLAAEVPPAAVPQVPQIQPQPAVPEAPAAAVPQPERKPLADDSDEDAPVPTHCLTVAAGLSSQPSDYFTASYDLAADYRNFLFYPLYFGGGLALGDALPGKSYPYTYNSGKMNKPSMYRVVIEGIGGMSYYVSRLQVLLLGEFRAGFTGRTLWNTELKSSVATKPYFGVAAGLGAGFMWHGVTFRLGFEYDSRFDFMYCGYLGYSFGLGKKKHG